MCMHTGLVAVYESMKSLGSDCVASPKPYVTVVVRSSSKRSMPVHGEGEGEGEVRAHS